MTTTQQRALPPRLSQRLAREDAEIRRNIRYIGEAGRTVLFPAARRLSDIMSSALPRRYLLRQPSRTVHTWKMESGSATLSSFCYVPNYENLDVVPSAALCAELGRSLILSDGYSVYFDITVLANGVAVVYAKYDQIIGSRVIAVIHSRSVPGVSP